MNPLQEAISTNEEGVQLLMLGNVSTAIVVFQNAVQRMRNLAVAHAENPRELFEIIRGDDDFPRQGGCVQRPDTLIGLQSDVCYIYDRPLLIPRFPNVTTPDDLDAFILTSSSYIIFNFALACHQFGRVYGDEYSLRRAGSLYNLTVKSLSCEDGVRPAHVALQCLALNNLAQLHYDHFDFQKSQGCLEIMYDLVVRTDCLDNYLNEDETEELMLNMVHMQPPVAACAA